MTASCPACSKTVDPLRAGDVAIFGDRFFYFCDVACRERFAPRPRAEAAPSIPPPLPKSEEPRAALASEIPPAISSSPSDQGPALGATEVRSSLFWMAAAAGLFAVALALAGSSPRVVGLRISLALVGWICIVVRAARTWREPTDPSAALLLAPGIGACLAAAFALFTRDPSTEQAATLAGLIVVELALSLELATRARIPETTVRRLVTQALWPAPVESPRRLLSHRAADAGGPPSTPGSEIELGAEFAVGPGDRVPVDGQVLAGQALVFPWLGASEAEVRREGDWIPAGVRISSGRLRARAAYAGFDRAWARLLLDPRRRADVHARMARLARTLATRGGLVAAGLSALAALANDDPGLRIVLAAIAVYAAVAHAAVASMPAIHIARGIIEGLRRGIFYRSSADWDRAGDVSITAFCARGTLLLGEPELADLEPFGKMTAEQVLALAAGAESGSAHPVATAIRRAAAARRIRANAVRSPVVQPRLGVSAIAANGDALLVGSRSLMLREKVSVAVAEQKIAEIEAHGREVLLVSAGGKLAGVLGLQDGLRPGARAAVQHLLDAQVEPVLLSGDSRETCEAIGRALDIDHVRAEIAAEDRAHEIERLSQGGLTVAVVGRSRTDEAALSAAHVAVAMPSPTGSSGEWAIMLASDDVRDGALAISLARRTRNEARASLILALAPPVVCSLFVGFGLFPLACAPIAGLVGALCATFHARGEGRPRSLAGPESQRPSPRLRGRLAKTT